MGRVTHETPAGMSPEAAVGYFSLLHAAPGNPHAAALLAYVDALQVEHQRQAAGEASPRASTGTLADTSAGNTPYQNSPSG